MKPKNVKKNEEAKGKKKEKDKEEGFTCGTLKKRITQPEDFVDDNSKQFYLLQIRNLEDKLQRYHHLCDQLSIKLQDSSKLYENNDTKKEDIISFLKSSLEKRNEELKFSEGQLKKLLLEAETQRVKYEAENLDLRRDFEASRLEMANEISTLTVQLKSLEKFRLEREEIRMEMESTLEELNQMKATHHAEVVATERKQVMHLNRLRNEVRGQVNRLAAAFSTNVKQKIREKARDTIQENVQNSRLLVDISCETQELLSENKELKERLHEMRLRMETMEETEKQLLCRSCCLRKVINLMKDEILKMQEIEINYNKLKVENETLRNEFEDQFQNLQVIKEREEAANSAIEELKASLDLAKDRAERLNQINVQLRKLLSDTAAIIRNALQLPTSEECSESEYGITIKRKAVVQQLSALLGTAAVLGIDGETAAAAAAEEEEEEEQEEEEYGEREREHQQSTASEKKTTVCEVDAATAFQRVVTAQRPSKVLPSRWRHESMTPQYKSGDIGIVPNRFSSKRPHGRLRSADAGQRSRRQPPPPPPPSLRASLVDRITDALLNQTT